MVKTELQKQLDTATLGPIRFLSKSIASSLSSIGQLIKSPKLLLPTIILSIIWAALSYLKLAMPYSGFIVLLSTLTFAQGGMYVGFMGAVGGVLGKALISYIVTSMFMPILTGKKSQKSVGMKIGPAFAISGGGGFALFFAGIGVALMLYNFKTGNGTAENMAIAVASIFGVFRSLKNPRGFIVEFIRSFSKGKMSRKKAGHFGAGLVFGYAVSILMAVVTGATGSLWYKFGTIFILLAVVLAFLSVLFGRKNRKNISSVAGVILVATILFGQILLAGSISYAFPAGNAGFLPAYESYNIREDDFEALKNAIINKPFKSAEITPIGVLMGVEYAPIKNGDSIVISEGEKTSLNISAESASIDEQYRLTDIYSFVEISFEGKLELFFDKGALEGAHYNEYSLRENRLPIYVQSSGVYRGGMNDRSDWEDGEPTMYFSIDGDLERYPVIFTDYKDLVDSYYSDSEKALYGDSLNPGDSDGQLYLIARLTGGNELNYSDGESVDGSIDAFMLFRVDGIGFDAGTPPTTAIGGAWVHKSTDYYAFNSQGVDRYSVEHFDGLFKEEAGVSDDGNTLFHRYIEDGKKKSDYKVTFSPLPKAFESEQNIAIKVNADAILNGVKLDQNEPNESIIFGGIIFEKRPEHIPGGIYNGTDDIIFSFSGGQLTGNMPRGTTAGEEVIIERIMGTFGHPGFLVIADTYVWEVQVAKTDKKDQDDKDTDGKDDDSRGGGIMSGWDFEDDWGFGDDWGWDESADGPGRTAVNIASVIGGIVGAGAAVAGSLGGGFGGPGGPGNLKIPGGDYDPSDGTLIITYPGGSQEMYVLNPETGNFEDNRGYILGLEGLDRHMKDLEKMRSHAQEDIKRMVEGTDGYSAYWKRLENLNKLKEKYEGISEKEGDKISAHMAKHLNRIQADINAGKGIDEKALGKVMNLHGKITRDEVADYSGLPGDYTNWQHAKDTMSLTTEEVARGETGLAISLRILSGILTGGKSEMGFEVVRSVYLTKDYVDQGMDNWSDITSKLAARTIKEEALGRLVMGGLKHGGRAVGKVAKKGSTLLRTTKLGGKVLDKLGSATKTVGDFLGQDIVKATKDIFGISSKTASDTAKAMKSANARAAREAIKRANKQLDDAVRAAGRQADDVAKAAAKQAESAGKTAAKQVEKKIARDSAKMADSYKQAAKQWDNAMKKGNNQAIEEIQKYRDANLGKKPLTSQRDQLFRKGQQIGDQKVANLKSAQDRLAAHPNAKDAQNAYDQAMRAVQQDKYAMNSLKAYDGPGANELKGKFNMRNEQYTQAALRNSKERLASEYGVDSENIKFVEATNVPGAGGAKTVDASATAKKVDPKLYTDPDYKGIMADNITPESARIGGVPMDKDVTGRIFDTKTKQWIDIPQKDMQRIYNQELYKVHHKGELPKIIKDGKKVIDGNAIDEFATKMDHTVTDRLGVDAFGRGDADLQLILDKRLKEIKRFEDITSVTQTMEYKSNEWFAEADAIRDMATELSANKGNKDAIDYLLMQAEAKQAEGVRQMVKMFDDQVAQQVKAAAAAGKKIEVPERLAKSVRILDKVGKPDGITMAQAEDILKGMNTSVDDVVQQSSALMEAIEKFK